MSVHEYLTEFIRTHRRLTEINNFGRTEINNFSRGESVIVEEKFTSSTTMTSTTMTTTTTSGRPWREEYKYGKEEHDAVLEAAAIIWQRLETHFLGADKVHDIQTIIEDIGEGNMGLIGPGDGLLTKILEKLFGWSKTFRVHALPHDVAGRFRTRHKLGPGYLYTIGVKEQEWKGKRFLRKLPVCGQLTGLLSAFKRRKEVRGGGQFQLIKVACDTISF